MANQQSTGIPFTIDSGELEISCLPTTRTFVNAAVNYLASYTAEVVHVLGAEGAVTVIHDAEDATIACRIDDIELGQVTSGKGCLIDRKVRSFKAILNSLDAHSE